MALKGDRTEAGGEIRFFMDMVAEKGGVVVLNTAGSGGYPGDENATVVYAASISGKKPMGILMQDMVSVDTSKYHQNFYKEQALLGSKVLVCRKGWYTTNMIAPGVSPAGGDDAYVTGSGLLTNSPQTGGNVKVGTWLSSKDQDGYAAVQLNI